jgi:hypothetical protein
MKHLLNTALGIVAAGFLGAQADCRAAAAGPYDPAADFSLNSNPNGVWSYGYSTTLGGVMTLHQEADANWRGTGVYSRLKRSDNGLGIYCNPTANTLTYSGPTDLIVWGPQAISLHPGEHGEFSVLRFTVPTADQFQVQGLWYSADQYYGANTDVLILRNGTTIFVDSIHGKSDTSSFITTMQLSAGETLDFVVGPDGYGNGWDSTGLSLSIVAVPEPSAMSLLVLGLVFWKRR